MFEPSRLVLVILYGISFLVNAGVIYWAYGSLEGKVGSTFLVAAVMTLLWNITAFSRFMSPGYNQKLIFFHLKYIFQWGTAVGWFIFAMHYTGRERLLTKRVWGAIAAFLTVTLVVTFSNPLHNFIWSAYRIKPEPFPHLITSNNVGFWMFLVFGYSFTTSTSVLLLSVMVKSKRVSKKQTAALASTFLVATVLHASQSLSLLPTVGYDYVSIVTTSIGATIAYTLLRRDLLAVEPVTRTDVMGSVQEGIIVVTDDNLVSDFNSSAESIFPELSDSIGEHIETISPALVETDEGEFTDELKLEDASEERTYIVEADPIVQYKRRMGTVLTLRDVTKVEQYARDLERQTEQLDEFASFVSHDLRNPLAVAQTYIYDLDREIDDDRLDTINDALDRMDDMIDDALTLAREGQAIEEREWKNINEIANRAWRMSDTAQAVFENDFSDGHEAYIDGSRMRTLFENMFRNAVDHGDEDVTVRVGPLESGDGLYIEDTGPGIPEEKRDDVFQKGHTTDEDGTGLGLAIVTSIIDAHDWNVAISESDEGGARFEITGVRSLNSNKSNPTDTKEQSPQPAD